VFNIELGHLYKYNENNENNKIIMYYLKRFQIDSEYQEFFVSEDFNTPNVSAVEENNKVYYNPKTILPILDTTGLATTFVKNEVYLNELNFFNSVWDYLDTDKNYAFSASFYFEDSKLTIDLFDLDTYEVVSNKEFDVSNEKIYKEYISKIGNYIESGEINYERGFNGSYNGKTFFSTCPTEDHLSDDGTFTGWFAIGCGEPE
jgi:hypothetical protein